MPGPSRGLCAVTHQSPRLLCLVLTCHPLASQVGPEDTEAVQATLPGERGLGRSPAGSRVCVLAVLGGRRGQLNTVYC